MEEEQSKDEAYKKAFKDFKERQAVTNIISNDQVPETPIDVAHLLIQNSNKTDLMPEIDKEVKLANLDRMDIWRTEKFIQLFQDLQWTIREQTKKEIESRNKYKEILQKKELNDIYIDEDRVAEIEEMLDAGDETAKLFDKAGLLRSGLYIPALSRGKYGFERTKQVETISRATLSTEDNSEKKPGFLSGMFKGGFKR